MTCGHIRNSGIQLFCTRAGELHDKNNKAVNNYRWSTWKTYRLIFHLRRRTGFDFVQNESDVVQKKLECYFLDN
jgi:hypothetical protein